MTDTTIAPLGEQALEKEKDQISIEQLEHHSHARSGEYAPAYLEFGTTKTLKVFWKATLFSMLVAVGAIFDAYAVTSERHS
jgi:hypothetical protein